MGKIKKLELLRNYISLDTSRKDGKYYTEAAELIAGELKAIGLDAELIEVPEDIAGAAGRVNVIARSKTKEDLPTLLVYNHMDVVPANYDGAFELKETNVVLYGRGAADHKGSSVALIEALSEVGLERLRFNLVMIFTTDEETEQMAQLEYLESKLNLPENTICFDPDTMAGGVTVAHLGTWHFTLTVKGKSAHSAASHLGVNAIEKSFLLAPRFFELKAKQEAITSKVPAFGGEQVRNRFNVNMLNAGTAQNVVPEFAELQIDCRFVPEANISEQTRLIRDEINKEAERLGIDIEFSNEQIIPGNITQHAEADVLDRVIKEVTGTGGGQYAVMGSTPVAAWCASLQIPHIGLGVARVESSMHGVDENCLEQDYLDLAEIFKRYVVK
ncbi:MAG: M20 family metallopeptidase [Candidatus Dojkabacteria bacterium]